MSPAQQIGENEPRRAGSTADRAIGNDLAVALRVDGCEQLAELGRRTEGAGLVVHLFDREMDSRGNMAGPPTLFETSGRPEALASVLGARAQDRKSTRLNS